MADDKDPSVNGRPPKEHEWGYIWTAADRANKSWLIVGPVHAVVTNWKALAAVAAAVVFLNRPKVWEAILTLIGGGP